MFCFPVNTRRFNELALLIVGIVAAIVLLSTTVDGFLVKKQNQLYPPRRMNDQHHHHHKQCHTQQPQQEQRERNYFPTFLSSTSLHFASTYDSNDYNENESNKAASPFLEQDGPKDQLQQALQNLQQQQQGDGTSTSNNKNNSDAKMKIVGVGGFVTDATGEERTEISNLAMELSGSNYVLPFMPNNDDNDDNEKWTLLYTNVPDILGLRGGPLSQLLSIQQNIVSANQLDIILEYQPSKGVIPSIINNFVTIDNDRLEQTVVFDYQKEPMNKITLQFKGTKIYSSRFGDNGNGNNSPLPILQSPIAVPLPFFGSFKVLFNDGDLCIQQTIQGEFLFIYKK